VLFSGVVRVLICGLLTAVAVTAAPQAQTPVENVEKHRATLDQYCVTCHNDRLKTSNLSLEKLDLSTVGDHPDIWERVVRKLRAGVMPPPGALQPSDADRQAALSW